MRTSTKSVTCPQCGQPATITLSEQLDLVGGTEGHQIALSCHTQHDSPPEPALLKLWATDRLGA